MAEWTDRAISLGLRRFGETGAILEVFARAHGRRRALIHGGASQKKRGPMQPGNTLQITWKGGEQSLGYFTAEMESERASRHMADAEALAGLLALSEILAAVVPESEPKPELFDAAETVLDLLDEPTVWPALFIRWELGLLSMLGYGLDLTTCAVSGGDDGLTHVSPKSGRAVRGSEAGDYLDRLLPLPAFLVDGVSPPTPVDIHDGFRLTGHFLNERLFSDLNRGMPEARPLMIDRLERAGRLSPR
ncbi:MAG: DNA repair protein RecO [Rhodobacterales bacterium 12-64-8]|nr:MAG: DNA repair protein RecO [Rhodobacterales bacterium 12-64-8]OYX50764.1 MAG: DNA repair protein RecO [Alphaproteobacteria bacterium 32-64-14]